MSSSLMAQPDWQMSISSNASSAGLRTRPRFFMNAADFSSAFRRFTRSSFRDSPRVSFSGSFFSDCANFRRRASRSTEGTEEQRAIVD